MSLNNKIDFALIISVTNANPNGDPLNGNRPRVNYETLGEISDVCLKRKIRNRLLDIGESIFVQSDDKSDGEYPHLKARADGNPEFFAAVKAKNQKEAKVVACRTWLDVRTFGQVFPFKSDKSKGKSNKEKSDDEKGVSIGVRGPVTIQSAYSLEPVEITRLKITKSVNSEKEGGMSSDRMGDKYRVDKGVYVTYGSINCQLADLTGFSEEDADKLKEAMRTIFANDVSAARPDGSMEVQKLIWWKHNCKNGQYSAAKVHRSLNSIIQPDGSFDENALKNALNGLTPEIIEGE